MKTKIFKYIWVSLLSTMIASTLVYAAGVNITSFSQTTTVPTDILTNTWVNLVNTTFTNMLWAGKACPTGKVVTWFNVNWTLVCDGTLAAVESPSGTGTTFFPWVDGLGNTADDCDTPNIITCTAWVWYTTCPVGAPNRQEWSACNYGTNAAWLWAASFWQYKQVDWMDGSTTCPAWWRVPTWADWTKALTTQWNILHASLQLPAMWYYTNGILTWNWVELKYWGNDKWSSSNALSSNSYWTYVTTWRWSYHYDWFWQFVRIPTNGTFLWCAGLYELVEQQYNELSVYSGTIQRNTLWNNYASAYDCTQYTDDVRNIYTNRASTVSVSNNSIENSLTQTKTKIRLPLRCIK